ncbi:MAG: hypothetical protein P8179_10705 [Candidatus Thiodiazotropha sp.]
MIAIFSDDRLLTISGELFSLACVETINIDENTTVRNDLNMIISSIMLARVHWALHKSEDIIAMPDPVKPTPRGVIHSVAMSTLEPLY